MRYAPACVESDGSKPGGRGVRAVVLALLVVGASLAGVVGAAAASTSTSDDGLVGVPDGNIQADLPDGADVGLSWSDLEGATETSAHADTTEVVLTTPERAEEYVGSRVGAGGGELALVIQDDAAHDGRRVSLPADALKAALGYLPGDGPRRPRLGRDVDAARRRRRRPAGVRGAEVLQQLRDLLGHDLPLGVAGDGRREL